MLNRESWRWHIIVVSALSSSSRARTKVYRGVALSLPLAKCVQDQLDAAGYSQLLKDPVNVVSDGVFLHVECLGNLTVFHAVGDQASHFLLATRKERLCRRNSLGETLRSDLYPPALQCTAHSSGRRFVKFRDQSKGYRRLMSATSHLTLPSEHASKLSYSVTATSNSKLLHQVGLSIRIHRLVV
jgi:hypothetical protein